MRKPAAGTQPTIRNRRKRARFPTGKTFDTWDPDASSIPAATQQSLRTLEWIRRSENLAVVGPSGTGKSHLLEALGNAAIDDALVVVWLTVERLGQLIRRHRIDDTVTKAVDKVLKADLIVVDDLGLLPVPDDAAEALFRVIDAAYERRSVAISSNVHPGGFDELLPATIASAGVDRFMHHAHVVVTRGRLLPIHRSPTRRGGAAADLTPWGHLLSADGEVCCPPVGSSDVRQRGDPDGR